jgi:hypothetical protein
MITMPWWVLLLAIPGITMIGLAVGAILGERSREQLRGSVRRLVDLAVVYGIPANEINEAQGKAPWS